MIFVVAALILLFVFMGKIMQKAEQRTIEKQSLSNLSSGALNLIDYGQWQLIYKNQKWQSQPQSKINEHQAARIAQAWQYILSVRKKLRTSTSSHGDTVLLYFQNVKQPLLVKIAQNDRQQLIVYFVEQGKQLELAEETILQPLLER